MAKARGKMRCKRKPKSKISGYTRCEKNKAGRRNTTAERRQKKCIRGGKRSVRVGGHRRRVCHT
jgi:hypothetical protein